MKSERSAGVIVYIENAVAPRREYLLLDYGRYWDFAKGHLEADEDDRTAALRELFEETGIAQVSLEPSFQHEIHYYFRNRKGELVRKSVAFFIGRAVDRNVTISDEHVGYAFMGYDHAVRQVTFANARQVLRLAEAHLAKADTGDRLA